MADGLFHSAHLQLLACVTQKSWRDMVCACSLKNWREALALLLTYSGPEKFPELCGRWPSAPGWSSVALAWIQGTMLSEEAEEQLSSGKPGRVVRD